MRPRLLDAATHGSGHRAPTGWLLVILILLALLYVGWRTGSLGKVRRSFGALRLRSELRGIRIRPIALVPTVVLLTVIVLLVLSR